MRSDDNDNKVLYGDAITHEDILHGRVAAPDVAEPLIQILNNDFSVEDKPAAETNKSGK